MLPLRSKLSHLYMLLPLIDSDEEKKSIRGIFGFIEWIQVQVLKTTVSIFISITNI